MNFLNILLPWLVSGAFAVLYYLLHKRNKLYENRIQSLNDELLSASRSLYLMEDARNSIIKLKDEILVQYENSKKRIQLLEIKLNAGNDLSPQQIQWGSPEFENLYGIDFNTIKPSMNRSSLFIPLKSLVSKDEFDHITNLISMESMDLQLTRQISLDPATMNIQIITFHEENGTFNRFKTYGEILTQLNESSKLISFYFEEEKSAYKKAIARQKSFKTLEKQA